MSGCGLSVSTTILIILVICQLSQTFMLLCVVPTSHMLLLSTQSPDNRNFQRDNLKMGAHRVGKEIKWSTGEHSHLSPPPVIFTSGALKVETSLLAVQIVSWQSLSEKETLGILNVAVRALNHLTSVMSSYVTAAPNPPCLVPSLI